MTTEKDEIRDCIAAVLAKFSGRNIEAADAVVAELEAMVTEQEGFVPPEKEASSGNSICESCEGRGFYRTEPLFGDVPHHDICVTCAGTGHAG